MGGAGNGRGEQVGGRLRPSLTASEYLVSWAFRREPVLLVAMGDSSKQERFSGRNYLYFRRNDLLHSPSSAWTQMERARWFL